MRLMMRNKFFIISVFLIILLTNFGLSSAYSQPMIEQIMFRSPSAHEDLLIFKMNGSHLPSTFALKGDRPRVVFDFPDVVPAKKVQTAIEADGTFIKQIRTGIHKGDNPKTRVVLDLQPGVTIDFNQDFDKATNTLTISIFAEGIPPEQPAAAVEKETAAPEAAGEQPPAGAEPEKREAETAAQPAATPVEETRPESKPGLEESTIIQPLSEIGDKEPEAKEEEVPALRSVEFDNTSHRGEIVTFRLNSFNPPVVFGIEEDVPRIVCFFKDTRGSENLGELIETNGKFIQSIKIGKYRNPDNVRVVLDLVPGRNYDLQQIFFKEDNLFMVIMNTTGDKPVN